ncbi:MAG: undecaprenyl-diphosphate phosphatase [Treponema sp.]|jgi:undecaprenyl-diphosphatase|nr:undecaprenyl-diphosphate phosphatase [Treponema sp.]
MSIFQAVILGAVQGITEFLPVSSSGHLVLFQRIFGITEPTLFFDTMVHAGTLAAVFAVLWKDIWGILRRIVQPLTLYLITATLPAVVFALLFKDSIENAFASGSFLGFAFLVTSALLVIAEVRSKGAGKPARTAGPGREIKWPDALIIGLLQAAAIVPGISRSGATLSGALSRGLDRDFAARFSFLLSIPAILGALVLQIGDLAGARAGPAPEAVEGIGAAPLAAGTLAAALVGFFSIRLMLKIVRERSLTGFAVYTGVLGALVLADRFGPRLFF